MTKIFDILLIIFVAISFGAYFEVKDIKENMSNKFAYHTQYWESGGAPDSSVEADPDTNFTFVVNYYANKDNSGAELYEIKLNYYTDYKLQDVYSLGLQIVNPNIKFYMKCDNLTGVSIFPWVEQHGYYSYDVEFNAKDKNYYATDDGKSFETTTTFNSRNVPYIIKIGDKPYAFDFNKKTTEVVYTNGVGTNSYAHYASDFDYFLYKIYKSTTKLTGGDGVYENLKLELTDVFNVYEYNEKSGKFDKLSTFGYDVEYISFKVNYFETGAKRHEHSLFNQIGEKTGGVVWAN